MKSLTLPLKNQGTPQLIFKVSALAVALSAISISITTAKAAVSYSDNGTARYSTIGDLSIYQPPVGETKPTIMLMLDKSGSMGNFTQSYRDNGRDYSTRIDSLWDDYGSLDYKRADSIVRENKEVTKSERTCTYIGPITGICYGESIRYYTVIEATNVTYNYHTPNLIGNDGKPCYYSNDSKTTVQNALNNGAYPANFKENFIRQRRTEIDGQSYEITYCIDTTAQDTRTAAERTAGDIETNRRLDRLSALKVAVFKLLRNPKMDENISVGTGAFGYNRDVASVFSYFGKIGVAAKPLTAAHKTNLRKYVAELEPRGGTPTAKAYTEAGAYVLGNSTANVGNEYSGFLNIPSDSIIRNTNNYIKPESSQCAGTGIYLLTDGSPNNASTNTQTAMSQSLGSSTGFSCNSSMTNASNNNNAGWNCIGDYAKALGDKGIKTAMVGFGGDFSAFDNTNNYSTIQSVLSDGTPYEKKYYRCDQLTSKDAQNSCNLGMESNDDKTGFTGFSGVGGFGEGGFYYAKDSKDIVNSVLSFVTKLDNDLASIPSGTITIPRDPLSAQNIQPYAYLPMLEPKVGTNLMIWPGNLKKYGVNQGTLYGRSATGTDINTRLYVSMDKDGKIDTTGKKFPADLNPNARDLWSTKNSQAPNANGNTVNVNDRITAGGFYARLKSPTIASNSTRSVYVESGDGLAKVSVLNGKLVGFDALDSTYGAEQKLYLLSFLGYDIGINQTLINRIAAASNQETELEKLITSPNGEIKVLGGVLHSAPTLVSYGGKINSPQKDANNDGKIDADAGQISTNDSDRNDYVMFGSMEGALHLAKSETGEEALAFVPKKLIEQQLKALKDNAVSTDISQQTPVFGVDAPWISSGRYEYTFNTDNSGKVVAADMKIYGGLGKGGTGLYGLDVSTINSSTPTPTKLFTINELTTGYSRMGMIMAKPVVGKIKIGSGRNAVKDVIIFGGGYDRCYEDPTFKLNSATNNIGNCNNITQAKGNAVYIADASTGSIIVSISGATAGNKNVNVSTMNHSIVSEITTLDRDNDGIIDHLYFGDLGGQVYRVDLQNGQTSGSTLVRRVTRVLNTSGDSTSDTTSKALLSKGLQYRFYTQPSVSFFQPKELNGQRIAVINIASGDRSSPLSRNRNDLSESNRIFGIIDRDIVNQNLYGDNMTLVASELTLDKLASLPFDKVTTPTGTPAVAKTKAGVIKAMSSGVFQGWSYPLTYFDGYSNVKHVKSMGTGLATGGIYYMTAYSPEMKYDTTINTCSAQVVGGSERQLYCLPWGICEAEESKNGTGGFVRAGKGIQELALGSFSKDFTNVQVLVGNQTFAEQTMADNRSGYGDRSFLDKVPNVTPHNQNGSSTPTATDGMGSAATYANMSGYMLNIQRWYQKSPD